MEDLFETIANLKKSGEPSALVIIVKAKGSTPRRAGAKMVVRRDGKTIGTMGGGDLEKRVIEEALEAIRQSEPRTASFTLDREKGKLDMMCGGELEIYIEPILPDDKVIIFGAGHITRSLAPMLQRSGFLVSVIDDSADLLQKDKFPEIENLSLENMEEAARELPSDPNAYVILLSRGFSRDEAILRELIQKEFKYVGMIGSMKKIKAMEENLRKQGVPKEAFSKLQAPIGMDIGGETPEEIAISIAAEIIAVKKGKFEILKKKGAKGDVIE
ncbi:MAG: XdhC family protein [Thermodesulfobacteriota bacterium]